jgi:hypothetical protein
MVKGAGTHAKLQLSPVPAAFAASVDQRRAFFEEGATGLCQFQCTPENLDSCLGTCVSTK